MAPTSELEAALASLAPVAWTGRAWRHTFGNNPVDRPNVRGARWNPPGTLALYASLARETALAEAENQISMQPVRPTARRTLHELQLRLEKVADLTDQAVLHRLGLDAESLASVDFADCQRVGGALASAGYDGMLVQSARGRGANLVIFSANAGPGSVDVVGNMPV